MGKQAFGGDMKNIIKKYWPFSLFLIALCVALFFSWKEASLKTYIYSEAIAGNRAAINLLKHDRRPWELNAMTVRSAIAGNENAQEVLGIKENKMIYTLIAATTLLTGSLNPDIPTKIVKEEKGDGYTFYKVSFSGHTYVYFRNHWSNAGNAFIHDPDCGCISRALEKMKEKNK